MTPQDVFRTSSATLIEGAHLSVEVSSAEGEKCVRCWKVLTEVAAPAHLCARCADAVSWWDQIKA